MPITPLTVDRIPDLEKLLALGEPYIRLRDSSDYWLYATLFADTCPLAIIDGQVAGSVIAFRSQVDPSEIYLQDVMTHPGHRREGIHPGARRGNPPAGLRLGMPPPLSHLRTRQLRRPQNVARSGLQQR